MTTVLHEELRQRTGLNELAARDEEAKQTMHASKHEDAPQDEHDRYAIYSVRRVALPGQADGRRRMAETSLEGIGLCLRTLREEHEYDDHDRIGILDRLERTWLINPWAKGA